MAVPVLGAWRNRPTDTASWLNRMLALETTYGEFQGHWSNYHGSGSLPLNSEEEQALAAGKRLLIYWKPYALGSNWAATAAGSYNSQIIQVAQDIKAQAPRQLHLTLHHEPENDTTGATGDFSYQAYKDMWAQVRSIFTSQAVTNVTWVWVMQSSISNPTQALNLWPGNTLVDITSFQQYINCSVTPTEIVTRWLATIQWLRDNDTPTRQWSDVYRPLAITETGDAVNEVNPCTTAHRAQTLDAIRGGLTSLGAARVTEIVWFDARTDRLDDPPADDGDAFQALKDATENVPPTTIGLVSQSGGDSGAGTYPGGGAGTVACTWEGGFTPQDQDVAYLRYAYGGNSLTGTPPTGYAEVPIAGVTYPVTQGAESRAYLWRKTLVAGENPPTFGVSGASTGGWDLLVFRSVGSGTYQAGATSGTATSLTLPTLAGVKDASTLAVFVSSRVAATSAVPSDLTLGTGPPSNTFTGGTHTTAITTGNSGGISGSAFDAVQSGTAPPKFDTTTAAHGGVCMKVDLGGTATECYVAWTEATLGAAVLTRWERVYLRFDTNPTSNVRVLRWLNQTTARASVQVTTAGKLQVLDSAGTARGTSAASVPLGAWFRVEANYVSDGANATVEVRHWVLLDSAGTPTETFTSSSFTGGGTTDRSRYGHTGTGIANVAYFLDDVASSPIGWVGPTWTEHGDHATSRPTVSNQNLRLNRAARELTTVSSTGFRKAVGIFPDQTAPTITSDLDHIQAIGGTMVWVVLDLSWAFPSSTTIDPTVAAKYDEIVNQAAARGLPVVLQAHGNPSWNITAGGHTPSGPTPWWHGPDNATERTNWVTMLHAAVNRWGAAKVARVGIWNEPNLVEFWLQGPNADHYARLLQACYVDLKATWPTIKVEGHQAARNDLGWLNAVYAATDTAFGASTAAANRYYFDVLGIHPYCGDSTSGYDPADTSHPDEGGTGGGGLDPDFLGYRRMRDAVTAKEGTPKNLAFGEFGYTTTPGSWFFVVEATRATYLRTAIELAAADGYVDYLTPYYHRPTDPVAGFQWHGTASTEAAFTAAVVGSSTGSGTVEGGRFAVVGGTGHSNLAFLVEIPAGQEAELPTDPTVIAAATAEEHAGWHSDIHAVLTEQPAAPTPVLVTAAAHLAHHRAIHAVVPGGLPLTVNENDPGHYTYHATIHGYVNNSTDTWTDIWSDTW